MSNKQPVEQVWTHLVASKPRLGSVLASIARGDDTLYMLSKTFGFSVARTLKELLELALVEAQEENSGGRHKKVYKLTDLGRRLLK